MEYDCIIVLANKMDKEGNLNLESKSRVQLASSFYFTYPLISFITCGWNYRDDSDIRIGNAMKDYAIKLGVPVECIITELNSRDTVGEAFFTKQNILNKKEWQNVLVVTSDYHVDRSRRIFEFIYGNDYTINVTGTNGFSNSERQIAEQNSLKAFERTFKHAQKGNDIQILEKLSTLHPYYNGDIYSKIA